MKDYFIFVFQFVFLVSLIISLILNVLWYSAGKSVVVFNKVNGTSFTQSDFFWVGGGDISKWMVLNNLNK